jgi:hypothetical protein
MASLVKGNLPVELHREYPLNDFVREREEPKSGTLVKLSRKSCPDEYFVISTLLYRAQMSQEGEVTSLAINGLELPKDFQTIKDSPDCMTKARCLILETTSFSEKGLGPDTPRPNEVGSKYKIEILVLNYFEYLGKAQAALAPHLPLSRIQLVQEYMS